MLSPKAVLANDALPPNHAFEGTRINSRALQGGRSASYSSPELHRRRIHPDQTLVSSVQLCQLPTEALLREYLQGGSWADCYATEVAGTFTHADFVEAFYTSAIFKVEQMLLGWFAARPSTAAQARELAAGGRESFAAWSVERRDIDQILLTDFMGRTRSWLMVASVPGVTSPRTRLYFGSAVEPRLGNSVGHAGLGFTFRALLGFHRLYSRALLGAAASRLLRHRSVAP